MKRTIATIAILSAICANTNAQEAKAGDVNVGITAGGGISTYYGGLDSQLDKSPIANIQGGVTLDFCFKEKMFIETGALFQRKGSKLSFGFDEDEIDFNGWTKYKDNLFYIEVPVTFNYRFNAGNIGIIPQAGPYVAVGVGGNIKTEGSYDIIPGDDPRTISWDEATGTMKSNYSNKTKAFGNEGYFSRFDAGVRMGVGLAFSPKVKLSLGCDLGIFNMAHKINAANGANRNISAFGAVTYYIK